MGSQIGLMFSSIQYWKIAYQNAQTAKDALADPDKVPLLEVALVPEADSTGGFIEIQEGKPVGSAVRIWFSKRRFACTYVSSFSKAKPKGFLDRVERYFSGNRKNYESGGFSVEAQGGGVSFSITKKDLLVHRFSPTSIEIEANSFDQSFSIVGKNAITRHVLASGLSIEEVKWIEEQRIDFCEPKGINLAKSIDKKY